MYACDVYGRDGGDDRLELVPGKRVCVMWDFCGPHLTFRLPVTLRLQDKRGLCFKKQKQCFLHPGMLLAFNFIPANVQATATCPRNRFYIGFVSF